MEQEFRHSLVAISRVFPYEALGEEKLDLCEIKTFWQAYHTSSQTSKDTTENRLECLFWRIWSSCHLSSSIDLRTLDRLVTQIMTPLSLHQLALSRCGDKPTQPKTNPNITPSSSPPHTVSHSQARTQQVNKTAQPPLHSILKKPRTAQSEPQKITRLLLEKPDGQSITCIPSNPPTPKMSQLSAKEIQSSHQGNKKTHSPAPEANQNTKPRQASNRRKSSQTSIPKVSSSMQQSGGSSRTFFESFDPLYDDDSFLKSSHNIQADVISEAEPGTSWLEVDSMSMSLPGSKQHKNAPVTSKDTGLSISDSSYHPVEQPHITPAVLAISDKQDPILPQGIEMVSAEPRSHENERQTSEAEARSSSDPIQDSPIIETSDVPLFPGAKSIPMPESMLNQLVDIVNNPEPLDEWIPLPERPWFLAEHAWLPLVQRQYLFDWMIRDHTSIPNPQPSQKELAEKDFRTKFQVDLERARVAAKKEANVDIPFAIPEEEDEELGWEDEDSTTVDSGKC